MVVGGLRGLHTFLITRGRCMDSESYLAPLIDEYGPTRVWQVGIKTLGYPPSWAHSLPEVLKVQAALIS